MNFEYYQRRAARTLNPDADPLVNAALGLSGETGEVIELVKKHRFHNKDLDLERFAEELGDVLWYLSALCESQGLSLDKVARDNITKLEARYPDGFKPKRPNNYAIADRWKLNNRGVNE